MKYHIRVLPPKKRHSSKPSRVSESTAVTLAGKKAVQALKPNHPKAKGFAAC